MAKLESLIVSIEAETAQLRKGLDDAKAQIKDFGKSVTSALDFEVFAQFGEAAVEAGKMLAEFALAGAELADHMLKASQSAGISVESFSQLAYAASVSGLNTEELGKAFSKLNQNLAKAGAGVNEQRALFSALGIAVKDAGGNVRGTDDVLADLAERFAGMTDGASKTALAIDVFGKAGAQLVPFLNKGRDGIAELRTEADRLGLTIGGQAAEAAEHFNENLARLHGTFQALQVRVASNLAPAMSNLTDQLLNSKDGAQALKDLAEVLTTALKGLTSVGVVVGAVFNAVGTALAGVASQVVHLVHGDLRGAMDDADNAAGEIAQTFSNMAARLKALWSDAGKAAGAAGNAAKESGDKFLANAEANKKAGEISKQALEELNHLVEEYKGKVADFGLTGVDALIAKLDSGALTKGITNFTGELGKAKAEVIELATRLQDLSSTKLSTQLNFKVDEEFSAAMRDFAARNTAHSNIGLDQHEQLQAMIDQSGIKSFDDALANLSEQTERYNQKMADLESVKATGTDEEIRTQETQLNIQKAALDSATKVADGFQKLGELDYAQWRANIDKMVGTFASLAGQLASKLGDLGSTISDTVAGFKSGGIYGAIAAFALNLFEHFKRFDELTQFGTQQLQNLVSTLSGPLNELTDNFKLFMVAMGGMTKIVSDFIGPPMKEFGRLLGDVSRFLTPLFGIIDAILQPLTAMQTALGALLDVVDPLSVVFGLLAYATNGIALVFDIVAQAIESALADFLNGISNFLADLHLDDMAKAVSAAAVSLANGADTLQGQIDRLKQNLSDPFATGNNSINNVDSGTYMFAQLNETTQYMQVQLTSAGDAAKGAAAAFTKFGEQITNAPQGFKYALEKFNATQVGGGSGGAYAYGTPVTPIVQITVQGSVVSEQNLISAVRKGLQVSNFRNNGVPHFP